MYKHSLFLFLLVFCVQAMAGLGREISPLEIPDSVCLLTTKKRKVQNLIILEEACSGFLISPTEFITAGHCVEGLNLQEATLHCPLNKKPLTLKKYETSPHFDRNLVKHQQEERWRDVAKITLDEPAIYNELNIAKSKNEIAQLLQETAQCAFFGFSKWLEKDISNPPLAQGVRLSPDNLHESESGTLIHDGNKKTVALVVPGDSGGPVGCWNSKTSTWTIFAIISARDFDYNSLFASLAPHHSDFISPTVFAGPDEKNTARSLSELGKIKIKNYLLDKCQNEIRKIDSSSKIYSDYQECQKHIDELIITKVKTKLRIKEYSNILLYLSDSSLEVPLNEKTRLLNLAKASGRPVNETNFQDINTVDHKYNYFYLKDIRGNQAIGDLHTLSDSESFMCRGLFLCKEGIYRNVQVSIDDLNL